MEVWSPLGFMTAGQLEDQALVHDLPVYRYRLALQSWKPQDEFTQDQVNEIVQRRFSLTIPRKLRNPRLHTYLRDQPGMTTVVFPQIHTEAVRVLVRIARMLYYAVSRTDWRVYEQRRGNRDAARRLMWGLLLSCANIQDVLTKTMGYFNHVLSSTAVSEDINDFDMPRVYQCLHEMMAYGTTAPSEMAKHVWEGMPFISPVHGE